MKTMAFILLRMSLKSNAIALSMVAFAYPGKVAPEWFTWIRRHACYLLCEALPEGVALGCPGFITRTAAAPGSSFSGLPLFFSL
jgi:hypothetical protein